MLKMGFPLSQSHVHGLMLSSQMKRRTIPFRSDLFSFKIINNPRWLVCNCIFHFFLGAEILRLSMNVVQLQYNSQHEWIKFTVVIYSCHFFRFWQYSYQNSFAWTDIIFRVVNTLTKRTLEPHVFVCKASEGISLNSLSTFWIKKTSDRPLIARSFTCQKKSSNDLTYFRIACLISSAIKKWVELRSWVH